MRGPITVGTSPTTVTTSETWSRLVLANNSDEAIYLQFTEESDALTTSNGIPLDPSDKIILEPSDTRKRAPVYAICASGGKNLRYSLE